MSMYLKGLALGLAYVAPIGMQNMFVINTALTQPRRKAFLTALIIIFFDVALGLFCFFGIGSIFEHFEFLKLPLFLVGGLIVTWIGIGLVRDTPTMDTSIDVDIPLRQVAVKAFVVTWINPQALIDGTMLFGSFRANNPGAVGVQMILGSASASVLWFSAITVIFSLFRTKFNDKVLLWINIICGAIIIYYGMGLFLQGGSTALALLQGLAG